MGDCDITISQALTYGADFFKETTPEEMESAAYIPMEYTPRRYEDITHSNWSECLYCGGSPVVPCQYNHVESRENGDARRVKNREECETVVDCPVHRVATQHQPHQRFTMRAPHRPSVYLRRGV